MIHKETRCDDVNKIVDDIKRFIYKPVFQVYNEYAFETVRVGVKLDEETKKKLEDIISQLCIIEIGCRAQAVKNFEKDDQIVYD